MFDIKLVKRKALAKVSEGYVVASLPEGCFAITRDDMWAKVNTLRELIGR